MSGEAQNHFMCTLIKGVTQLRYDVLTKQRVFQQLQSCASWGKNMLSKMGGPNTCICIGNDHMVHVYCRSVILHVDSLSLKSPTHC